MYTYCAELIRVVDGDTIYVRVDLGFRLYRDISLRLEGINAPELKTTEGKLSKAAAMSFFDSQPLKVETYRDPGSYDRYTARVYRSDGVCFNDWMVQNGYAVAYDYKWG
jgi:micrococcal nuclease